MATDTDTETIAIQTDPRSLHDYRHRITVEEFHRMAELGVFGAEPRVELLEGVIVDKMTKNPPHVIATDLIQEMFGRLLPVGYFASMGNPVSIEERDSEPEPDVQVIRGRPRDSLGRRRTQADAALVIEVSDTSYAFDRYQKSKIYAAARVPVYWILDLNRRRLEVHTDPISEGAEAIFRAFQIYLESEEAPLILDGREVARFALKDILP
ncbi:Uma2 family endonuclease [soil metagenome]